MAIIIKQLKDEGNYEVFKINILLVFLGIFLCSIIGSIIESITGNYIGYGILIFSWIIIIFIDSIPYFKRCINSSGKSFKKKGLKHYFEK
jgi:hypothetical protein